MSTFAVAHSHHPKTGERRRKRRSLRLERLPLNLLNRVREERAKGHTWAEIERNSPHWQEWEKATPEVLAGFPQRRLPHTNLQRWYDLRVEQVQRDKEGQVRTAQALADRLAEHGVTNLDAAVKNALSDSVFHMMLENADRQQIRDELLRLARLLSTLERDVIARGRLELNRAKLRLAERKAEAARRPKVKKNAIATAEQCIREAFAGTPGASSPPPAPSRHLPRYPASAEGNDGPATGDWPSARTEGRAIGRQPSVKRKGKNFERLSLSRNRRKSCRQPMVILKKK